VLGDLVNVKEKVATYYVRGREPASCFGQTDTDLQADRHHRQSLQERLIEAVYEHTDHDMRNMIAFHNLPFTITTPSNVIGGGQLAR